MKAHVVEMNASSFEEPSVWLQSDSKDSKEVEVSIFTRPMTVYTMPREEAEAFYRELITKGYSIAKIIDPTRPLTIYEPDANAHQGMGNIITANPNEIRGDRLFPSNRKRRP